MNEIKLKWLFQDPLLIILVLISFLIFSCADEKNPEIHTNEYHVRLALDSIYFELDSITSLDFEKWRYNSDQKLFYFFNKLNPTLYIYKVGEEFPVAIIPIDREGPNGIPKIDQIHVHNLDSIFILSQFNDHFASLINREGKIQNRFILSNSATVEPFSTLELQFGKNDFYFHQGKLYLPVGPRVENYVQNNIYPSLLIFDMETLEKEYVLEYPKRSREFNFGPYGSISYGLLNPATNDYVLCFPYEHSLMGVNLSSKNKKYGTDSNSFVRLANTSIDDHAPHDNTWYYYYHGWYDKMLFNPLDTTIWRMATVGFQLEKGQDTSDPSLVNIHGGKENFYTFIYDKNLELKGYVKEFLHLRPVLFIDGKMYKMATNRDPETAESRVIFKRFELVKKVE